MEYKNSFVLYESVFKHFERLQKRDKELALEYINAIMNYGLYGEAPAEDSEIWDFGIDSDIASINTAKKKFSKKINIPKEELQEQCVSPMQLLHNRSHTSYYQVGPAFP